ncbi:hypothetical protein ACOJUR_11205 [Alicyclobacillus tolerans]|uniref:hypothetical protein n=1 Tax=Alicyclobacillus tolerans TaxID=90970 RepID=UPI003B7B11DF
MMKKKTIGLAAAVATLAFSGITAYADGSNHFQSQYEANSKTEASLWSQVQSNSSNTSVNQLISTVSDLNTQINTLYNTEQNLENDKSTLDSFHFSLPQQQQELKQLNEQRMKILIKSDSAWKLVVAYWQAMHVVGRNFINFHPPMPLRGPKGPHGPIAAPLQQFIQARNQFTDTFSTGWGNMSAYNLLKLAIQEHNQTQKQLWKIDEKIAELKHDDLGNFKQPLNDAIPQLQATILHLQKTEISYTKLIIEMQSESTSSTTYGNSSDGVTITSVNSSTVQS